MISAYDLNDPNSARIRRHMPDFFVADPPDPEAAVVQEDGFIPAGWEAWHRILRRDAAASDGDPYAAMSVQLAQWFRDGLQLSDRSAIGRISGCSAGAKTGTLAICRRLAEDHAVPKHGSR